jgi:hypothetical protein
MDRYQILEAIMNADADGASYWRKRLAKLDKQEHNAEPHVAARRLAQRVARAAKPSRNQRVLSGRALRRAREASMR